MKKSILALVLVMLLGVVNVNAATESELRDALSKDYTVNGKVVNAKAYLEDIDAYLAKYDISSEDADFIIEKINYILDLAKADKATSFTELSSDSVSKAIAAVAEIKEKTSVKATLTNNGVLTVYESDGKTVFVKIQDADKPRQTGSDNLVIVAASLVTVLGAIYITRKVAKANA